jgi:acyl carrier protein phosphodiesterase
LNYLAHILLSGDDRALQVGNFIGDFVKGSRFDEYPSGIRDGILLHRQIDSFTDAHPAFKSTVEVLRPAFGRYSGILADMYYENFVGNNFYHYSGKKYLSTCRF